MDVVLHRMSAAGNAFYLAVGRSLPLAHAEELAQVLSRGDALWPLDDASPPDLSDGLIFGLLAGGGAPPRQIMHNPDGSRGHCANGVRCLAWLLAAGNALPTPPRILTDDGEIWAYAPATNEFELLGDVVCPGVQKPYSMAVDRQGIAW